MFTVIAEILMPSEQDFKIVLASFNRVMGIVRKEQGCHGYELYVDSQIDSQMQTKVPYSIVMYEKWETIQHLEEHMQTTHMLAHKEAVKDKVLDIKIRILEKGI
ncbi:putative quinol monooxygenase [Acinetobacter silvestris]|uniref:Antibiotic biosynthesis monooxygenase n=1 Tax=Acinetobacter silvestris TaxID=1977882 RepID=A0A1Y3CHA0_9GAMM|nr:antibiotic biosynthesis monooxygenase [Acinetobacter silvestris]OTG65992.1 antibiotic biosynthesis monooxygenase [Acinetobacter silvestris]